MNSDSHVNRLSGNVAAIHKIVHGRRDLPGQFLYSSEMTRTKQSSRNISRNEDSACICTWDSLNSN